VSYPAALSRLRYLAWQSPFQPGPDDVPVQVLGLLESAGLDFDRLWVCGLHDDVWPAPARPTPFLSLREQRRLGLPHSSPERELAYARRVSARLLAAATAVVASHPLRDGERELRPSPLIADLPGMPVAAAALQAYDPRPAVAMLGRGALERPGEDAAPPLGQEEAGRGGSRVLQLQAACPFRAFAELRLGATGPPATVIGPDARVRGAVLHEALQRLWERLGSHAGLAGLDREQRSQAVVDAVQGALSGPTAERPGTFTGRFRALETERLRRLLLTWLECELAREPFQVVGQEVPLSTRLAGVPMGLRVDRVDRLQDGGLAILDYKSGQTGVADWLGERPEAPQLPLYALAWPEPVTAVMLGRVRPVGAGFAGLAARGGIATGVLDVRRFRGTSALDGWDGLGREWHRVLEALAEGYRSGRAEVDPRDGAATCRYCELQPLCRIHERSAAPGEPE
jgi:probable DNA repair protein